MPEGPEIRRAADTIAAAIQGHEVETVSFAFERLKPWERQLAGTTVLEVATFGKAMLTRFGNGLNIYSHNQLYGRWYCGRRGEFPPWKRQLRLAIHTRSHSALLYSASDISVLRNEEVMDHPFIGKLGPDLLASGTAAHRPVVRRRIGQLPSLRDPLRVRTLTRPATIGTGRGNETAARRCDARAAAPIL